MPETKEAVTELFLRRVPITLKTNFKAACAEHGESMQDAIIHFMTYYVQEVRDPLFLKTETEQRRAKLDRLRPMRIMME